MKKLYNVSLANRVAIFDEAKGLEGAQAVHEFIAGHGGTYVAHIDNGVNFVSVLWHDTKGSYVYDDGFSDPRYFRPNALQAFLDLHI